MERQQKRISIRKTEIKITHLFILDMNYNLKLDLAKLKKVGVANITGKTGNKVKCVVIPVEENNIFLSEKGGIYMDLACFALKQENYGQSHLIKQSLSEEERKSMTEEERNAMPIVGALKPMKAKQAEVKEEVQPDPADDLPF